MEGTTSTLRGGDRAHRFTTAGALRIDPPGLARDEAGRGPQDEVERREWIYRHALALSDVVAATLALALSGAVHPAQLAPQTFALLPIMVMISKILGLYDRDDLLIRKTTIDEAPRLLQLAAIFTLILWLGSDLLLRGPLNRGPALILWATLLALMLVGRRLTRSLVRRNVATERCLFFGDRHACERLRGKFQAVRVNAELVGRMTARHPGRRGDREAYARELRELVRWGRIHRVIIDPQVLPAEQTLDMVRAAKASGVRVSLLPRVLDVVGSSVVFDDLAGMTVLGIRRFGLTQSSRALKRAFDLAGAPLLLVLAAPAMLVAAVAIKLGSRGPVLFRQTRVGRDGRRFQMLKFRTMVAGADDLKESLRAANEVQGGLFKIADDPRITRVGRVLRRTSLDELPQLLNVLGGSMSLVGPRPLVVDEDEQITGWDRHRLSLTPGVTGPWQIAGSSRVPMPEMVKIDYVYVAGWSLWEDLKILLRTIPYVLSRRGQ